MSYRLELIIENEFNTLLRGLSMAIYASFKEDGNYAVDDIEKEARPFLRQAYCSGYYDGKGDAIEGMIEKASRR